MYNRPDQGATWKSRSTSAVWGFILKTKSLLLISLLALLAAPSIYAQANQTLRVDIPFGFNAAGKYYPAGHYEISPVSKDEQALNVVSPDGKNTGQVPVLTRTAGAIRTTPEAHVVFDKFGERYVLSEVWYPAGDAYILNVTKERHEHRVINVPIE
jgi:hypothetical protein